MTMKKRGKVEARFVNTEKKAYWQIEEGMDRRTKRWTGAYTLIYMPKIKRTKTITSIVRKDVVSKRTDPPK